MAANRWLELAQHEISAQDKVNKWMLHSSWLSCEKKRCNKNRPISCERFLFGSTKKASLAIYICWNHCRTLFVWQLKQIIVEQLLLLFAF